MQATKELTSSKVLPAATGSINDSGQVEPGNHNYKFLKMCLWTTELSPQIRTSRPRRPGNEKIKMIMAKQTGKLFAGAPRLSAHFL